MKGLRKNAAEKFILKVLKIKVFIIESSLIFSISHHRVFSLVILERIVSYWTDQLRVPFSVSVD